MLETIIANLPDYLIIASSVVGAFSLIATQTANTADNKVANILLKLINFLGANFGKAANKEG